MGSESHLQAGNEQRQRTVHDHAENVHSRYGTLWGYLFEKHEPYKKISWEPIKTDEPYRCGPLARAKFDINNDGIEELVVKWSPCLRGNPFDVLYIHPSNAEWIQSSIWPSSNMGLLFDTPNMIDHDDPYILKEVDPRKNEGVPATIGKTILQPFIWKGRAYVTMTDMFNAYWIAIIKYLKGSDDNFEDFCYFKLT